MGLIICAILLVVIIILMILVIHFITKSLKSFGKDNDRLKAAHSKLGSARWICVTGIIVIIILIVLYIIFGAETAGQTLTVFVHLMFLISLGIITWSGVYAAIGAEYIREGGKGGTTAQKDAIVAAALGLGAAGGLAAVQVTTIIIDRRRKKKAAELKAFNEVKETELMVYVNSYAKTKAIEDERREAIERKQGVIPQARYVPRK